MTDYFCDTSALSSRNRFSVGAFNREDDLSSRAYTHEN